jgi:hypothetical protein
LIEHTMAEQFTPESFLDTFTSVDTVEDVLPAIARISTQDMDIDTRKVV